MILTVKISPFSVVISHIYIEHEKDKRIEKEGLDTFPNAC